MDSTGLVVDVEASHCPSSIRVKTVVNIPTVLQKSRADLCFARLHIYQCKYFAKESFSFLQH